MVGFGGWDWGSGEFGLDFGCVDADIEEFG